MAQQHQPDKSWHMATPQDIPSPTYWPVVLAMGVTFLFWGFVTSIIISLVGLVILTVALVGWISELRQEYEERTTTNQT